MSRVIEAVAASPFVQAHAQEARTLSRAGFWIFLATLVPIGLWLTLAPLTSAVVAQGFVKVDLNRRPVQHAEGGMVREVMVRDGQVRSGKLMGANARYFWIGIAEGRWTVVMVWNSG